MTKDITEAIPLSLSRSIAAAQQAVGSGGAKFDVNINGIGFMMASSDQRPYLRQTAPIQKQQLDTAKEAGEQTLDGYWTRSQTSWHHGSGIRFYEPGSDETTPYRFEDSLGVDVFTRDKVQLLKRCEVKGSVSAGQTAYATGAVVGGNDVVFTNENGVVKRRDAAGTATTYTAGFSAPLTRVAVGGAKIYSANSFGIDQADASGSAFTGLYTQALGTTPIPYWVKSRLIATRGASIFELAPSGTLSGATPGNLDTVTPLYSHPDANWAWSDVAEAPTAILASGFSNGRSAIYRFSLEDAGSGTTPVLSQAYQAAEMPAGEEILALKVVLGTYIGIGTTKGLRVGIIGGNGDLQYGPLLLSGAAVRSITSADRFIYGAVTAAQPDGKSGLVVVDLAEELKRASQIYVANTLIFPYSWHARTGTTGRVDNVTTIGVSGRVAMGVFGEGVYYQSATLYEASGWVRSGRVRYSTVEQKKFRLADVGTTLPVAAGLAVGLYVIDEVGNETYVRNLTPTSPDGRRISLTAGLPLTYEYVQFRMSLTASADSLTTPTLDSLQVKAVPVVQRQELIQLPLMCFDRESTASGTKYGREGYAYARFSALKVLENESAVVSITEARTGETYEAQIEQVEFREPTPKAADNRKTFGGHLSLTIRK